MGSLDVLGWAGLLYLAGIAVLAVIGGGLLWAARSIERRLDRIIDLLEHDHKSD